MRTSENETVDLLMREARDKYTVHECNECNWRKSCMGRKFGDSECVNERQSISLAFGIEDGYFSGLLDRIEAAHGREVDELNFKLMTAKSEQKTMANAIIEQVNAVEKLKCEMSELRKCLKEAVGNECNYCRTVRKDGTYGKCEHLRADGECDHLRGVQCMVHRWRKALEGAEDGSSRQG